jgi:hypothetical protein
MELLDLAHTAAEAVVAAMATQTWESARAAVVRWLGGNDPERVAATAAQLDAYNADVARDERLRRFVEADMREQLCLTLERDNGRRREFELLLVELEALRRDTQLRPVMNQQGWTHSGSGPMIGAVHGSYIQQAPPTEDHYAAGLAQLRQGCYAAAAKHLIARLAEPTPEPTTHYYLALALLGDRPPRDHPDIGQIVSHLNAAAHLPKARLLQLVVHEDRRGARHNRYGIGAAAQHLIRELTQYDAMEIAGQFRAGMSPTWREVARRAGMTGGGL